VLLGGLLRPRTARTATATSPTPRTIQRALRDFAGVVGDDWVFNKPEDVALYRDSYSLLWGEPDERVAAAAVAPANAEQVVALMRIANRLRIPVYPISTGKNLGYGGAAPVLPGSVVLDLKRMNRVLELNERNAYALVEPGVSYFDLYEQIQERKLKLWIDCPGPGWGSLVGNALDRGLGYTLAQYRNHFDAHCGMEVVLPTGKLLRTGMGAMPNAETWQQFKSGFGPWVDGLFSQSNFGVVTKMGFWLMPQPEAFGTGRVLVPRYRDLIPLVDIINRLEASHILQGFSSLSCPIAGTSIGGGPTAMVPTQQDPEITAVLNDQTGFRPERLEPLGLAKGIPFWSCDFNFYGPRKLIAAQWECAQDAFKVIPGARFELTEVTDLPLTQAQSDALPDTVFFGIPTLRTFSIGPLADYQGAKVVGHVFFSPVVPRTGEAAIEANAVLGGIARKHGLPVTPIQFPNPAFERAFLFVVALPVTRDVAINTRIRVIFRELVQTAAAHGWGEYRTTPAFYDDIMKTYSFNDHALLRFHESLKDAVDPNGILSAGRYGIWPSHLRQGRG
jgi:4-cresol dehydrogenase (hydroxylating)